MFSESFHGQQLVPCACKPMTRRCHCEAVIHTSMHSPWQQVSPHPVDQHMGLYCFGSRMSLSCAVHAGMFGWARPHIILDSVSYTSVEAYFAWSWRSWMTAALCTGSEISTSFEYQCVKSTVATTKWAVIHEQTMVRQSKKKKTDRRKTKRLEIICVKKVDRGSGRGARRDSEHKYCLR